MFFVKARNALPPSPRRRCEIVVLRMLPEACQTHDSRMERGLDSKGMIYPLKCQFLDGGNYCSSSVWLRIVMEKEASVPVPAWCCTLHC
jgi:hypothetical protein